MQLQLLQVFQLAQKPIGLEPEVSEQRRFDREALTPPKRVEEIHEHT